MNKIRSQRWQAVILSLCPTIFDDQVLPLNKSNFLQPISQGAQAVNVQSRGVTAEKTNDGYWLLRPCHHRPRRRAAQPRDEVASFHSITSSARAITEGGTSMPRALAVFRLITSSNLM